MLAQPISDQYAGSLVAGFKYQPGGLSRLHQRGGLSGCAGIGRDAYFVSNRCRRRSCARRVLFLKRAFSIQATLIASQKAPLPYLASASAQMPRPAEAAERTIPPMRNWRGVMLGMVLLIRGARQPLDLWGTLACQGRRHRACLAKVRARCVN
jgi:hypothetical protein